MSSCGFIIVEFHDGLQLIPAIWFNADKQTCIWPSHYKTKLRINKAIIKQETPQNESDWEELPIKRIFGVAETYEKGIEKLVTAQDTSNVENSEISSNELTEKQKQQRRNNAKKRLYSSSSDDEDKENQDIHNKKRLPSLPKLQDYVLVNKNRENIAQDMSKNTLYEGTSVNKTNSNDIHKQCVLNDSGFIAGKTIIEAEEENHISNDTMQNKINLLEEKMLYPNNVDEEFINVQLPISLHEDLQLFEEQLDEERFKNKVINILKLVGGSNPHVMIRNILKKLLTNSLAQQFSWAGKKAKSSFKDLRIANIITQAVRAIYNETTDAEISNSVSKWFTQGTLRMQRERQCANDNN